MSIEVLRTMARRQCRSKRVFESETSTIVLA
jgi:hypothetical protein